MLLIRFWELDAAVVYSARFAVSTARSEVLAGDSVKVTHDLRRCQIAWSAGCLIGTDGAGADRDLERGRDNHDRHVVPPPIELNLAFRNLERFMTDGTLITPVP